MERSTRSGGNQGAPASAPATTKPLAPSARDEFDKVLTQLHTCISVVLDRVGDWDDEQSINLIWLSNDLAEKLLKMREDGHV